MRKPLKEWLLSPWVILGSMGLGLILGIMSPFLQHYLSPLGHIYLTLLQMLITPIVITAITSSLGNLLHSNITHIYIRRLILIFGLGLLIASFIAIAASMIVKQGENLDPESKAILGKQVAQTQNQPLIPTDISDEKGLLTFVQGIVPTNVFQALAQNRNLSVLFFFVLLGVALGLTKSAAARTTLACFDAIYLALLKIVTWIIYGLPLGLCFLFAGYAGEIGLPTLTALSELIILFVCICVSMMIIYSLIIWKFSGLSYLESIRAIKTPLFIAFGTSSSFAAIPATLKSLQENLKLDRRIIDFIIPLGANLHQQGSVIKFVLAGVFIAHLYGKPLDSSALLIISFTSIAAAIAASGIPGIASVGVFAMVLDPLGLPVWAGIVLLTVIEPIVDPIYTTVNVWANCAAATMIAASPRGIVSKKKTSGQKGTSIFNDS